MSSRKKSSGGIGRNAVPATPTAVARYFDRLPGGFARCALCHRRCLLSPGSFGACRVRRNAGGTLELPFYGMASAVSIDPIEKKPLYHFLPGSSTYSVGYVGCNLRCPFCQNFSISQSTDAPVQRLDPAGLAESALRASCPSISHTYSEPIVHAEFVEASMRAARAVGLKNVLVTNGCAGADAASSLLSLCDAVNVDIKCWDADFYHDELGGDLETVKAFAETAFRFGTHLEVTTLIVPGKNDDDAQVDSIAAFLASLSPDIPLHISAYRP
ncbi:MAG: AmmeMemoRadiSam system radical SAM enzyme, partial [Spirochaetes bacterium]|nr:AmmeMemoRadiSam system radical SAM enzyme [Spirochaetota bacterium]